MVFDQKAPPKESFQERIDRLSRHPSRRNTMMSDLDNSDSSISSLGGASLGHSRPTGNLDRVAVAVSSSCSISRGGNNDGDYGDERNDGSGGLSLSDVDAASDKSLHPDFSINLRIMAQTNTSSRPSFYCSEFCNDDYKGSPTNLCFSDDVPVNDFIDTIANILATKDLFMTHSRNANREQIYFRNSPPISLDANHVQTNDVTALNKEDFQLATLLLSSGFQSSRVAEDEGIDSDDEQVSPIEYVLDVFVYCKRVLKRDCTEASPSNKAKKKKNVHEKVPLCKLDVRVLPPIFKNMEKGVYETKEVASIDNLPSLGIDGGNEIVNWGYVHQSLLGHCREDERYFRNDLPALGNNPQLFILDRRGARKCIELTSTDKMWELIFGRNFEKKKYAKEGKVVVALGLASSLEGGEDVAVNESASVIPDTRSCMVLSQDYRNGNRIHDAPTLVEQTISNRERRKNSRSAEHSRHHKAERFVRKLLKFERCELYHSMHIGHYSAVASYLSTKKFGLVDQKFAWEKYTLNPSRDGPNDWPKMDDILPDFSEDYHMKLALMTSPDDLPKKNKFPIAADDKIPGVGKGTTNKDNTGKGSYGTTTLSSEMKRANDLLLQQSSEGVLMRLRFVHHGRVDFNGCIIPLPMKGNESIWNAYVNWKNTGDNAYNPEKNDCMKFTDGEATALVSGTMEPCFTINNMKFSKDDLKQYNIAKLISVAFLDNSLPANNHILVIVSARPKINHAMDPNVFLMDD